MKWRVTPAGVPSTMPPNVRYAPRLTGGRRGAGLRTAGTQSVTRDGEYSQTTPKHRGRFRSFDPCVDARMGKLDRQAPDSPYRRRRSEFVTVPTSHRRMNDSDQRYRILVAKPPEDCHPSQLLHSKRFAWIMLRISAILEPPAPAPAPSTSSGHVGSWRSVASESI